MTTATDTPPLELVTVPHRGANGVTKNLPAVHQTWKAPRDWVAFVPPPTRSQGRGDWHRTYGQLSGTSAIEEPSGKEIWTLV